MDLKDIRSKGEHSRLLGKVLIEKDDIVISIKGRDEKEPVNEGLCSYLKQYVDEATLMSMKQIINEVYLKKMAELNSAS